MKNKIKVLAVHLYKGMGDEEFKHYKPFYVNKFNALECMRHVTPDDLEGLVEEEDIEEFFFVQKSGPFLSVEDNDGEMVFTFCKV